MTRIPFEQQPKALRMLFTFLISILWVSDCIGALRMGGSALEETPLCWRAVSAVLAMEVAVRRAALPQYGKLMWKTDNLDGSRIPVFFPFLHMPFKFERWLCGSCGPHSFFLICRVSACFCRTSVVS